MKEGLVSHIPTCPRRDDVFKFSSVGVATGLQTGGPRNQGFIPGRIKKF
jgi:hypothetical protein